MDHAETTERRTPAQVLMTIRVRRTMFGLPETTIRTWIAMKGLIFSGSTVLLAMSFLGVVLQAPGPLRVAVVAVFAWCFFDQVMRRKRLGTGIILLTTHGVLSSEHDIYVPWTKIESWTEEKKVFKLVPVRGAGPKGLFASGVIEVPVFDPNRVLVRDIVVKYLGVEKQNA